MSSAGCMTPRQRPAGERPVEEKGDGQKFGIPGQQELQNREGMYR